MNSESHILEMPHTPERHPTQETEEDSAHSKIENQKSKIDPVHPAFGTGKRGNGYVARLPKNIRDQLNNLILDGVPYAEIIRRLGEPTKHLNPSHLKEWKKRG